MQIDVARRRKFTGLLLAAAATAAVALPGQLAAAPRAPLAAPAVPAKRPNVIVIMVDDLGWPDVSAYGRGTVPTPNLERLAKSGAAYTNGYVAASVCAVSRAGLLTGRRPQSFGFQYNLVDSGGPQNPNGLPLSEKTLADRLKAVGYHTAAVGKWHQGYAPQFYPMRRGFDEFYGFLSGETLYADVGTPGIVTTPTKNDKPMDRKPSWGTVTGPDMAPVDNRSRYLTDDFTDRAVDFIGRQDATNPFFLYLAYNAPHWPLQVPQAWYDRFAHIKDPIRRTYVAMIAAMDAGVGRVIDTLEARGMRDDTMIVFLSDNGCPEQFGFCDCSHPLGAGKFTYVEGGTRVPFIVSWPRGMKARGLVDTPVSSLDIVPTALRAAAPAAPLPKGLDGQDLRSLDDRRPRTLLWGQAPVWAAREGKWKLWTSDDWKRSELYDLTTDPAELKDQSARQPQVKARMTAALTNWRQSLPAPSWPLKGTKEAKMCAKPTEWIN